MNYRTTQSGKPSVATGADGSFADLKERYDVTLPKLIKAVSEQSEYILLCEICDKDNVPGGEKLRLIEAARFYFNRK